MKKIIYFTFYAAIVYIFFINASSGSRQILFRASPGGDGVTTGFWGGFIDFKAGGGSNDLNMRGYTSWAGSNGELGVVSTSHDKFSDNILIEINEEDHTTVLQGSHCLDKHEEPITAIRVKGLVDDDNPYFMDSSCGWKCGWTAFTIHKLQVYFIMVGIFGTSSGPLMRQIQIRRLEGCEDLLTRGTEFKVLKCSIHVATVSSEVYSLSQDSIKQWPVGDMIVVQENGTMSFYFQVIHLQDSIVRMNMLKIRPSGAVEILYSKEIDDIYGGKFKLHSMGSVSFKDDVLCWTAAEELICGLFKSSRMIYAGPVLKSGEASEAQICSGGVSSLPIGKILSGVAVADTSDGISLYFGCYPQTSGIGGVGLVRILKPDWSERELYPVTNAGRRAFGGNVLILDETSQNSCFETTSKSPRTSMKTDSDTGSSSGSTFSVTSEQSTTETVTRRTTYGIDVPCDCNTNSATRCNMTPRLVIFILFYLLYFI